MSAKLPLNNKVVGMFQRARRTKKQAAGRGTSRYPNSFVTGY